MKYKNIKSIAHNLGHSFLSDMNATGSGRRYVIVPELLFAAAAQTRVPEVRIDFINRTVVPSSLMSKELQESVAIYAAKLFELCKAQNVEEGAIRHATMTISFDYDRVRRASYHPHRETQEFQCTVDIEDDSGATHRASPNNWWR